MDMKYKKRSESDSACCTQRNNANAYVNLDRPNFYIRFLLACSFIPLLLPALVVQHQLRTSYRRQSLQHTKACPIRARVGCQNGIRMPNIYMQNVCLVSGQQSASQHAIYIYKYSGNNNKRRQHRDVSMVCLLVFRRIEKKRCEECRFGMFARWRIFFAYVLNAYSIHNGVLNSFLRFLLLHNTSKRTHIHTASNCTQFNLLSDNKIELWIDGFLIVMRYWWWYWKLHASSTHTNGVWMYNVCVYVYIIQIHLVPELKQDYSYFQWFFPSLIL